MTLARKIQKRFVAKPNGVSKAKPPKLPEFTQMNTGKFLYCRRLFDLVRNLEGDVVECGVGAGVTFLFWASLCCYEGARRRVWGFDSFEGFPAPTIEDASPRNLQKGELAVSTPHTITELLVSSGFSEEWVRSYVTLVKGFFEESLPKYTGKQIALLHLDADLYESYKTSLEELYAKVQKGGVIAFDEYMGTFEHIHFPGARRAIDEFFADRDVEILRDQSFGKYYMIKTEA